MINFLELRLKAGLSQRQLASKIGYHWRNYQRVEKGRQAPSPAMLEALERALDLEPWSARIAYGHLPDFFLDRIACRPGLWFYLAQCVPDEGLAKVLERFPGGKK